MKNRTLPKILLALLTSIFLFVGVLFFMPTKAYAYATLPTNSINNIFDETKVKFLKNNLDNLAQKAQFDDFESMIKYVEDGGENKTAEDFQHITVKFGKAFGGEGDKARELEWIPAYLSNSAQGPILTLWLANPLSEGIMNLQYNTHYGTKPASNSYSTSYMRANILNHTGKYYTGYNNDNKNRLAYLSPIGYTETTEKTHIVQMYTTGVLSPYIVAPSQVGWQTGEGGNRMVNDVGWAGHTGGGYFLDKDGNEQTWIEDKLWLPSVYETVDKNIAVNSLHNLAGDIGNNGGLWNLTANERSCPDGKHQWTRSGCSGNYGKCWVINPNGAVTASGAFVNGSCYVRPALHLNLKLASENMINHEHVWESAENDGWVVTTPATCTTNGVEERICTVENCDLTDNKETRETEINSTAHSFNTTTWTSDENNHWHASTCGHNVKKDEEEHSWDSGTVTKDATCTQNGVKTYTCSVCKFTKTEEISTIAHTSETIAGKPPTCTQTGLTDGSKCSVCGTILTPQEEIEAKGHTREEIPRVEPTCEGTGLTAGEKCKECGTILTIQTEIPASGHKWSEWSQTRAPTEETEGEEERECGVCHKKETQSIAQLEHTHKYATEWSSDEINHWHAATCGHADLKSDEAAHDWGDGVVTKEATCSAEGVRTYTCSVCKRTKTEAIEKIAHTEVVDEAIAATCTTAGKTEGKHCSVCKEVLEEQKAVPALEHDYKAAEGGKAPTCTEDGFGKVICSRCGDEKEGDVIPATGHKHEVIAGKAATCTEAGLTDGDKCPVCGTVLTEQQEIKALGHDFNAWVETKPATYTEDGEERRECQRSGCTHFETRVIPMKVKVAITVTINPASSEMGEALETLTATVTSGTLIDPADMPYTLSTDADVNTMGTYTITGVCTDERYSITFIEGVYIVSKKADDPNGGGEIDLPVDINVEFKVTQSSTNNDYSDLEGMKQGYWAQLWYRNEDGTLGDEFTDTMNCILTLKIPTEIIEAIRGGEEINREKIENELSVYYFVDGQRYKVDNFAIAMRDDESWQIKFNYNAKFRAEVVFNAAAIEEPTQPAAGIPWWVWLIVGLAGAAVVGVVIVIIVVAKKKNSAAVAGGAAYDDAELRAQLTEQDKKLDEIREIVDGGFNDIVDDE